MVAHHRQISAAGHAHAHDGGDLRNPHGAHHRVIAKDAAEIVGIRKNILLQGQKNARGIDQVDGRDMVFNGDILRSDHFLGCDGEKCACFYCGIIRDNHHEAARHACEARNRAPRRRPAPFLIHFVSGINTQLKEVCFRVDQPGDALACREPAFFVLPLDRFCASALLQLRFFILDFRKQVHHAARVLLVIRRIAADAGLEEGAHRFSG